MPAVLGYHPNGSPAAAKDLTFGPLNSQSRMEPRDEAKHSPEELLATGPSNSLTTKDAAIAEFFSQKTFQLVLHNPTTAHQLHRFSQDRMCGESMAFLKRVASFTPGSSAIESALDFAKISRWIGTTLYWTRQ